MSSNISNGNGDSQSRKSSFSREKQFGNSQSKEAVYTRDKQLDDFYDRGSFKEFDERRAGYQKAEEENAKLSAKFVQPAAPVINYNVGGGGGGYRDYQEEKEAHIKKELTEAKKLETERQIVLSRAKLEQETEEDNEFENRKNKRKGATEKNKWDTSFIPGYFSSIRTEMEQEIYDEAKRKANLGEQDRKNKALFLQAERKGEMAGVVDAHTHALSRLKAGAKVLAKNVKKDFVTPVVNGALDVVENPKNKRMVKNAIGAAQGVTKEIERDMLAYAKAKVIMNGTAEFNEEQVLDKDGNVKGFKRVFKQNGNRPANPKTNFGLQPAVQPRTKGGPKPHKGNLTQRAKGGPTNNGNKAGPTNRAKPGPTNHRRSGVKLVKSKLPTVQTNRPEAFNQVDDFEGFEPKQTSIFGNKSFAGFEKRRMTLAKNNGFTPGNNKSKFTGFATKPSFHPINTPRSRAPFESQLPPQGYNPPQRRSVHMGAPWKQYQAAFRDIVNQEDI